MLLVKSRPIPLPVWYSGTWRDDFAVTGAKEPGYFLSSGAKDIIAGGIRMRATVGGGATLDLPAWLRRANFEAETVARLVAGASQQVLQFRRLDGNNRWYVEFGSTDVLRLTKMVASVTTTVATITGIPTASFQRIGIRAVGPLIEVFVGGRRVISVSDVANIAYTLFHLSVYDATAGTAQGDWQYLYIKPL